MSLGWLYISLRGRSSPKSFINGFSRLAFIDIVVSQLSTYIYHCLAGRLVAEMESCIVIAGSGYQGSSAFATGQANLQVRPESA
jgi:hypothetical protein